MKNTKLKYRIVTAIVTILSLVAFAGCVTGCTTITDAAGATKKVVNEQVVDRVEGITTNVVHRAFDFVKSL